MVCLRSNSMDRSIILWSFESVSQMLETYYATKNTLTRIHQKSSDLRRIVQTALERNRKKLSLQEKQMKDTAKKEKYKVYGGADQYLRVWAGGWM